MNKKKDYICSVCNTSWECYVFTEFSTPFSICKYCYMDIDSILNKSTPVSGTCILCDTAKECFKIPLSNNPARSEMILCRECFSKIKELIREGNK